MSIELHPRFVPKKDSFRLIYIIFWSVLIVALAVSLHLGLNSTFVWYLEHTSFRTYEVMVLGAVILLVFALAAGHNRAKRLEARGDVLETRLAALRGLGDADELDTSELQREIGEIRSRRERSWRIAAPMVLMIVLFLACSVFALLSLSPYLLDNFRINTVFVLFMGSVSKIVTGLVSVVLLKFAVN